MSITVFVYGTLKRGCKNHSILKSARFLGEAKITGATMLDLGPFPCVIPGDGEVKGEIYQVNPAQLRMLDILEGHPNLYERHLTPLGDDHFAWTYFLSPKQQLTGEEKVITDGYWKE